MIGLGESHVSSHVSLFIFVLTFQYTKSMPKANIEQRPHMPSSLISIDNMNATHILQNDTASNDDNSSERIITIQDQSMRTVRYKI